MLGIATEGFCLGNLSFREENELFTELQNHPYGNV